MGKDVMELEIISPEKTLFSGQVRLVRLPGTKAPFTVLYNHAPMITSLVEGKVSWESAGGEAEIAVSGGFAEIRNNHVTLCVETGK